MTSPSPGYVRLAALFEQPRPFSFLSPLPSHPSTRSPLRNPSIFSSRVRLESSSNDRNASVSPPIEFSTRRNMANMVFALDFSQPRPADVDFISSDGVLKTFRVNTSGINAIIPIPTAPMALFVDAAFLDVLRNEFYPNNVHTGATMIPGYLALVDAIDLKGVLQHYALPCNNRRELKEWAKEHLLENYAFTWREGSIEEIRKAGCLWIEDGDGKIDAYERIRLRDTSGPLYLLDEEVLMLREFEYACQVRVKNLIVLDPSPRLSWIPKTNLHMFPCEHCESGAGRDDYVPWFSKYLIKLRRHLAFTPSTRVLLDLDISSSCISEATDKCELCFKAYLKELTRFQWLFIRKMEEEIAAVEFPDYRV